jgi:uronate dehydrogenase
VPEHVLITGAAGQVGTVLRPLLHATGRRLRLLDPVRPADLDPAHEDHIAASITDLDAMRAACDGVALVVHLGGHSRETAWENILQTNIHGTYVTLEAAYRAGVTRVLLAGSAHAVGFVAAPDAGTADELLPRPDTYYGVGKVAAEALGSVYADHYGLSVVSARIGTVETVPRSERSLSTWLSPADLARLVEVCLKRDEPGHRIVNAISANTRRWMSLTAGETIGYHPLDDAEDHATSLPDVGPPGPPGPAVRLGGLWSTTDWPLGEAQ